VVMVLGGGEARLNAINLLIGGAVADMSPHNLFIKGCCGNSVIVIVPLANEFTARSEIFRNDVDCQLGSPFCAL
jgi:hypothetical protein